MRLSSHCMISIVPIRITGSINAAHMIWVYLAQAGHKPVLSGGNAGERARLDGAGAWLRSGKLAEAGQAGTPGGPAGAARSNGKGVNCKLGH